MVTTLVVLVLALSCKDFMILGTENIRIPKDRVVLLRQGTNIAAVIFTKHEIRYGDPPRDYAEYDWMFRNDGGMVLEKEHPSVQSGSAETTGAHPWVAVGPFRLRWSFRTRSTGWIYREPNLNVLLAITDIESIDEKIDFDSQKYTFHSLASTKE